MIAPSSNYTEANGLRLHYLESGARKALIKAGSGLRTPDIAKTMRRLQQDHPKAELTALPNCGHFLQEDEPQRVAELISQFLNRA
jgi:pimeloyl-ACP methyl ester carboxylesterase